MIDQTCKCCGQTLPIVLGFDLPLSDGQKRLLEAVRRAGKHGIDTNRLFDAIYSSDPDGGPLSGTKTLHVRISTLNKALQTHGWRITGTHPGRQKHAYGRYFLRETVYAAE